MKARRLSKFFLVEETLSAIAGFISNGQAGEYDVVARGAFGFLSRDIDTKERLV